jgi:hypothetical protein
MARKAGMISTLLIGLFIVSAAIPAQARWFSRDCESRTRKAEMRLRKAEEKHGRHSVQAQKKRHELQEIRERCGREHR